VDLNYLYRRHQISLFMADHASCEKSRLAHRGLAEGYAGMIAAAKTGAARSDARRILWAPSFDA
jgi:hypothetical protein